MAHGRRIGKLFAVAAIAAMVTTGFTSTAQADGHNAGAVSLEAGFDITTEYWFRGIPQEDQGVIFQPYAEVSFDLAAAGYEGATAYFGVWNSIHDGPSTAPAAGATSHYYEADWYIGLSTDLSAVGFEEVLFDISYVFLTSPAGLGGGPAGLYAQEVDFLLSVDDSGNYGDNELMANGLQPYLLFVVETAGGSDGAALSTGLYIELGIEPSMDVTVGETDLVVSIPVSVGFNGGDYYEGLGGAGFDEDYGFFSIGLATSLPLDEYVPADYGTWTLTASVTYINLNSTIVGPLDDNRGVFTAGIGMEY